MYNFNKAYDLILEDIIQSVTPEELKERQKEYYKILLKQYFAKLIEENKMVKLLDGSYAVYAPINLARYKLASLLDLPYKLSKVNGYFYCYTNNLTDLEGCPRIINNGFDCCHNNLTNLKGCPKIINNYFYCSYNLLTSLIGCPIEINGYFNCSNNNLTNLEGCPRIISKEFDCSDNNLTSLEGCPKEVKGDFWIRRIRNGGKFVEFTEEDIRKVCKVRGDVIV